ncbi:MAG: hypothetical protein PQJ59_10010 [Spirochaetales bacterium]|nr:hypothetical protein [Spirochaetales bacterium]
MKKKIVLLLTAIAVLSFITACKQGEAPQQEDSQQASGDIPTGMKAMTFESGDFPRSETLRVNYNQGRKERGITYYYSEPLTLQDGTTVSEGDLKPTWQYIEQRLGINIEDVSDPELNASETLKAARSNGYTDAAIYGGNGLNDDFNKYGVEGDFVNLRDYLNYMPHVTEYFDNNPMVAKYITNLDGGIYYLPYIAEINYYARVLAVRPDWITGLLDGSVPLENETKTLTVQYEGYWSRNLSNVIDLQNSAARGSTLDRDTALNTLLAYIEDTYPNLSKPSDLYLGETALYDMDELVALWRVIRLSPNTLSRISTGKVVPGAEITPFFVRKTSYREDVLRLVNFFDGERCHNFDSYSGSQLYMDSEGEMHYSYAEESFLEKVNYLEQLYAEGLILEDFTDTGNKTDYRKLLFFTDDEEGRKDFGFMTLDWVASTTLGNKDAMAILPPVTTITKAGVYRFIHYMENTRSIKPDGWAISASASEEERNAALLLFDYIFSEEGSKIQNYSLPDLWEDEEVFVGLDGRSYPLFNAWAWEKADELKGGDLMTFLRDYMGSRLNLGFQKELGAELQTTTENGFASWALYTNMNVLNPTYNSTLEELRLMPPDIPLTDDDWSDLKETKIGTSLRNDIMDYIVGDSSLRDARDLRDDLIEEDGLEAFLEIYKYAYNRMMEDM